MITTYPLVWRDIDALAAQRWHLLVLDEAQMVKNAGSRAAAALRRLNARHRLCVTGTPLENHLGELWAHFDFLMPGFLGDARTFTRIWRKPIEVNGETAARATAGAAACGPSSCAGARPTSPPNCRPRPRSCAACSCRARSASLYESVRVAADAQVRRALERQGFDGAQIVVLDALLKLRQVCCDPRLVKGPTRRATWPAAPRWTLLCQMLPAHGRRRPAHAGLHPVHRDAGAGAEPSWQRWRCRTWC